MRLLLLLSALADEGELDEAEKLFVKALADSPNNVSLRINYGKLLAQKDQYTSALCISSGNSICIAISSIVL